MGEGYQLTLGNGQWEKARALFGPDGGGQYSPDMVSDEPGQLYLAWNEYSGGEYSIHFASRDPESQVWSAAEIITASNIVAEVNTF